MMSFMFDFSASLYFALSLLEYLKYGKLLGRVAPSTTFDC